MAELKLKKKSAIALGSFQVVLGCLLLFASIKNLAHGEEWHAIPLGAASLFILSGGLGIGMAKNSKKCLVVSSLLVAVLACILAVPLLGAAAWGAYGDYDDDYWGCPDAKTGEYACALNVSGQLQPDYNDTCVYIDNEKCTANPNVTSTTVPQCEAVELEIMCAMSGRHHGGKRRHHGRHGDHGRHRGRHGHRHRRDDDDDDDDDDDHHDDHHGRRGKWVACAYGVLLLLQFAMSLGQVIVASIALCCKSNVRPQQIYEKPLPKKAPLPEKVPLPDFTWASVDVGPKAEEARAQMFSPPPAYSNI